jgi:steroid delta-isomerase-like uncharacterized protein
MATQLTQERIDARLKIIDEHVYAEVVQDLELIMKTWGERPDFDDVPYEEQWAGRDEIRTHYIELIGAFPDLGIEVHKRHITENCEFVILETTVTGTHTGDWRDLPATGRKMAARVCALYSFDDEDMLNLERTYYDNVTIYAQLGIYHDPRTTFGKVVAVVTPPFIILRAYVKKLFRRGK